MLEEIARESQVSSISKRFRFHPIVRFSMILLSIIAAIYSVYFIAFLIPRYQNVTMFFKIISVVVLYISGSTLFKHLTALNSVIIRNECLELRFLLRKRIIIPWHSLIGMEIYKVITHYWKLIYNDSKGKRRIFKTALAFPGIMNILLSIQDKKPDLELSDLLRQVLIFKRSSLQDAE